MACQLLWYAIRWRLVWMPQGYADSQHQAESADLCASGNKIPRAVDNNSVNWSVWVIQELRRTVLFLGIHCQFQSRTRRAFQVYPSGYFSFLSTVFHLLISYCYVSYVTIFCLIACRREYWCVRLVTCSFRLRVKLVKWKKWRGSVVRATATTQNESRISSR